MQEIPITSAPFFQEYTFSKLNSETDAERVMERWLAYGDRREIRWLFETYGQERIKSWLRDRGAKRLPRRRYPLGCVLLDVVENVSPRRLVWPY